MPVFKVRVAVRAIEDGKTLLNGSFDVGPLCGREIAGRAANDQAVQRALEAAGVEFLNHGQPGVRLRKAD